MANQDDINKALGPLKDRLLHHPDLMLSIAEAMKFEVDENFRQHGRPAWDALKPSTVKDRTRKGYGAVNILIRTGQLIASIQTSASENEAVVSTNKIYAAMHQYGGTITIPPHSETHVRTRYTRKTSRHKKGQFKGAGEYGQGMTFPGMVINITPRPFLVIPETGIEKIKTLVLDYFTR